MLEPARVLVQGPVQGTVQVQVLVLVLVQVQVQVLVLVLMSVRSLWVVAQ